MEVIVSDGMSDDGTREILAELSRKDPRIRVIDNPRRLAPAGLNAAILAARGKIIVRADAHAEYAPNYVAMCVRTLDRTKADVVGGPWRAKGKGYVGRAIAAAFRSPFGMGGGRGHDLEYEGYLDSVYLGCWYKERLVEVGMYDEDLVRNEDDELNLRIHLRGGKVYQCKDIKSVYFSRNSLIKLFRQYYQWGFWKVAVILKHHRPASVRHLVPGVFVLAIVLGAILSPFHWVLALAYGGFWAVYLVASVVASCLAAARDGWTLLPALPIVFFVFHFSYGLGFLHAGLHSVLCRGGQGRWRRGPSSLTR
jgi:glycosyltransferase involved in cell wall biosynthesis